MQPLQNDWIIIAASSSVKSSDNGRGGLGLWNTIEYKSAVDTKGGKGSSSTKFWEYSLAILQQMV